MRNEDCSLIHSIFFSFLNITHKVSRISEQKELFWKKPLDAGSHALSSLIHPFVWIERWFLSKCNSGFYYFFFRSKKTSSYKFMHVPIICQFSSILHPLSRFFFLRVFITFEFAFENLLRLWFRRWMLFFLLLLSYSP